MEELKAKRTVVKRNITRLESKTNSVTIVTEQCQVLIHIEKCAQLSKLVDELELEYTKETSVDPTEYIDEISDLQDRLDSIMTNLLNVQRKQQELATGSNAPSVSTVRPNEVRLPKLQLPIFDGQLIEWLSFSDLFRAAVHNNHTLSGAQKLQYLKASLKGEASSLIQSISVSDSNYEEAWDLLNKRYENKRELIQAIIKRLVRQPVVQHESATALRKLIDTSSECVRQLRALSLPIEHWDAILVYHVCDKLDANSRQEWELTLKTVAEPTFSEITEFLDQRSRALNAAESRSNKGKGVGEGSMPRHLVSKRTANVYHTSAQLQCVKCNQEHRLFKCSEFENMSTSDRVAFIKSKDLCFNCLKQGHSCQTCVSSSCRKCNRKHHTLLHYDRTSSEQDAVSSNYTSHVVVESTGTQVLLGTAIINVRDRRGQFHPFRALLDSASEVSFVTEKCVQSVGVQKQRSSVNVIGISASSVGTAHAMVDLQCKGVRKEAFSVRAVVLPKITKDLPKAPIRDMQVWSHIKDLQLADPSFHVPGAIDILLGADIFSELLMNGKCTGPEGTPVALQTALGWVLMGQVRTNKDTVSRSVSTYHVCCDVNTTMRKFWEFEELPSISTLSDEEKQCELHFEQTHKRDSSGRYIVRLPFRSDAPQLGRSRDIALKRLKSNEQRLSRLSECNQQYADFLDEYRDLGHMEPVPARVANKSPRESCYLPHHYVKKESSTTTKLRVVFDASAKSSSGVSLNDKLMVGPKLQDDIIPILLRFRNHLIPLCADIAKMYRQIRINDADADYQRILWRDATDKPVQEYRLLTVTYGTGCAPYLATKCLQRLARDEGSAFPLAAQVVLRDIYVDDVLSGASSSTEAIELQTQLISMLQKGGFELRKWSSSSSAVLEAVPEDLRETKLPLCLDKDGTVKALGVTWSPSTDQFTVSVVPPPHRSVLNKRTLLSDMAKIFDPLGLLSPTTIKAKLLLQSLWRLALNWDEQLPQDIGEYWLQFCSELCELSKIKVDRCLVSSEATTVELVGFCDASEAAYAAVVYCRSIYSDGHIEVKLVAAKTRVAPVKQVSLPRLELCGAVLLSQLIRTILNATLISIERVKLWTDSTIVLAWLASPANRWKTFVANRVAIIQEHAPVHQWGHVRSEDNPADCASRGVLPSDLVSHHLWWTGPQWLHNATLPNFNYEGDQSDDPLREERKSVHNMHVAIDVTLINNYSSLTKLNRISAWILRFITNCRATPHSRLDGPISVNELNQALLHWVKCVQQHEFSSEIQCLKDNKPLPRTSRLLCLFPFIDEQSILRVGGRLQHARIPEQKKHPVLLPRQHKLTELVIMHYHVNHLHAGAQLISAIIQERFWIMGGRSTLRKVINSCVKCFRQRSGTAVQLMGNLPAARVNPGRAFKQCGVDYAGPITLKNGKGRSQRTVKGYVALFVCFATKAIHVELVSDVSAASFIAALKRFIARRGRPSDIYSDNGTNFLGANKELKRLLHQCRSAHFNEAIANQLSVEGIKWHFNPAAAPHFGGLWEAGVKSTKYHLRRIVGNTILSFEELYTVLTQIEACLNSRPLTALSNDPNDLTVLTPAHFLIGESLLAIPEPDLTDIKLTHLSRWQLSQRLVQHFWKRWSSEYLSRLQQRPKWRCENKNIQVGNIVLVKDEVLPPLKWKLARVVAVHPGSDNLVRTATIKTRTGTYRRPIVKLAPLPFN